MYNANGTPKIKVDEPDVENNGNTYKAIPQLNRPNRPRLQTQSSGLEYKTELKSGFRNSGIALHSRWRSRITGHQRFADNRLNANW